jgi:hypothetical protein
MPITQVSLRDKKFYLEQIAERDKIIYDMKISHDIEIAEKDRTIKFYRKTAERATERKQRAITNSERRAKLNFSWALLIFAAMMTIPWLFWFIDLACKNFWLWANVQ